MDIFIMVDKNHYFALIYLLMFICFFVCFSSEFCASIVFLSLCSLLLEFSSFMKKFVASLGLGLEEMELSSN